MKDAGLRQRLSGPAPPRMAQGFLKDRALGLGLWLHRM